MPHYKDLQNKLHFLDDAHYEYLLPAGAVAIINSEADAIIQEQQKIEPPSPSPTLAELQAQLVALTEQINALAQK